MQTCSKMHAQFKNSYYFIYSYILITLVFLPYCRLLSVCMYVDKLLVFHFCLYDTGQLSIFKSKQLKCQKGGNYHIAQNFGKVKLWRKVLAMKTQFGKFTLSSYLKCFIMENLANLSSDNQSHEPDSLINSFCVGCYHQYKQQHRKDFPYHCCSADFVHCGFPVIGVKPTSNR